MLPLSLVNRCAVRSCAPLALKTSSICGARVRLLSTTPSRNEQELSPKDKATSIINHLPGSNIVSKTGILFTGAAASVYAISNQLYVISDESIIFAAFLGVIGICAKFVAPLYGDFANKRMEKISEILNESRNKHLNAVNERIDDIRKLDGVVDSTKVLFEVSKETVQLESEIFELEQKVKLANEAKSVLDSWIRHEDGVKKMEQKLIIESVKNKIEQSLNDSKFQDQILNESVSKVEALLKEVK